METKIINGVKCRRLKAGEIIKNGDRFPNDERSVAAGQPHYLSQISDHWSVFRPLSPKKAKRKAKKVESGIKAIKAWGILCGTKLRTGAFTDKNDAHFAADSDEKVIRVEIRPLVTRKKGK